LPSIYANTFSEIADLAKLCEANRNQPQDLIALSSAYRRFAIIGYFLSCSLNSLSENFLRSVQVYFELFQVAQTPKLVLSEAYALFDSLAAKDFKSAEKLAKRLSSLSFNADREYVEDYTYFTFLLAYLLDRDNEEVLMQKLAGFESVLEEGSSRYDYCAALIDRDADRVSEALCDLAQNHREKYIYLAEQGAVKEEEWVANGQFFVEGVALKVLAENAGINIVEKNIPGIPLDTQSILFVALSPNSWLSPS